MLLTPFFHPPKKVSDAEKDVGNFWSIQRSDFRKWEEGPLRCLRTGEGWISEDWIGDSALSIHHNTPKVYLAIWRTLAKIPGPKIGWPTTNEPLQPPTKQRGFIGSLAAGFSNSCYHMRDERRNSSHLGWTKGGLWQCGMDGGFPFGGRIRCHDFCVCFLIEVPTIGHYLIDMEKYFSDAYDALFLKKQRCDIAMATPFPNEELCGHKICQYYASWQKLDGLFFPKLFNVCGFGQLKQVKMDLSTYEGQNGMLSNSLTRLPLFV